MRLQVSVKKYLQRVMTIDEFRRGTEQLRAYSARTVARVASVHFDRRRRSSASDLVVSRVRSTCRGAGRTPVDAFRGVGT